MKQVNRVLGALLSVALLLAGLLVVVEVIAFRVSGTPVMVDWRTAYGWAGRHAWQDGTIRTSCALLILVGLLLLALELKPQRPSRLRVASDLTDAAYTRRGVAAFVRSAVGEVEGIERPRVKVRWRAVRVSARTSGLKIHPAGALREQVVLVAQSRLDELELAPAPGLAVRVKPGRS